MEESQTEESAVCMAQSQMYAHVHLLNECIAVCTAKEALPDFVVEEDEDAEREAWRPVDEADRAGAEGDLNVADKVAGIAKTTQYRSIVYVSRYCTVRK
jgi:hypothetical protein